jgi:hypothetical protein
MSYAHSSQAPRHSRLHLLSGTIVLLTGYAATVFWLSTILK